MGRIRHTRHDRSSLRRHKRGGRSVCALLGSRCQSERNPDVYTGRKTESSKGSQAKEERNRVAVYSVRFSLHSPVDVLAGLCVSLECRCKATGDGLSVSWLGFDLGVVLGRIRLKIYHSLRSSSMKWRRCPSISPGPYRTWDSGSGSGAAEGRSHRPREIQPASSFCEVGRLKRKKWGGSLVFTVYACPEGCASPLRSFL